MFSAAARFTQAAGVTLLLKCTPRDMISVHNRSMNVVSAPLQIYNPRSAFCLNLVGVGLVLGLKLEALRSRPEEHLTIKSKIQVSIYS